MHELTKARAALARRAEDKRLGLVPGLADDLRAIGDALGELERRIGCVAAFACIYMRAVGTQRDQLHPAEVESIAAMSDHARSRLKLAGLLKGRGEG